MKSKYVILSIVGIIIMGLWLGSAGVLNTGLHPVGIIALPLYIINSIINPELGGICQGDCSSCWQYGDEYMVIQGQCKIPSHIEECRDAFGGKEVTFLNDKCELKNTVKMNQQLLTNDLE